VAASLGVAFGRKQNQEISEISKVKILTLFSKAFQNHPVVLLKKKKPTNQ